MVEIASEKGISHPMVSRRIEAGLNQLHEALRRRGLVVAAAATLSSLLMENAAQAAPAAIIAQLARISLLGAHTAAGSISPTLTNPVFRTARTVMTVLNTTSTTKLMVVSALGALVLTGTISYWYISPSSRSLKPPTRPEPLSRMTYAPQSPSEQDPSRSRSHNSKAHSSKAHSSKAHSSKARPSQPNRHKEISLRSQTLMNNL